MSQPAMSFEEALDVLQGMFSEWSRPALSQMLQGKILWEIPPCRCRCMTWAVVWLHPQRTS